MVKPSSIVHSMDATASHSIVSDSLLVGYGSCALRGAGSLITEATYIKEGSENKPGIYTKEQENAWRRIVNFVHKNSDAKFGVQLAYPKSDHRQSISAGRVTGQSADMITGSHGQEPRCNLMRSGSDEIIKSFANAASAALRCGFDLIDVYLNDDFWKSDVYSRTNDTQIADSGVAISGLMTGLCPFVYRPVPG